MSTLGERKQFCSQGHDTFITGRYNSSRACKRCTSERSSVWQKNNPEKLRQSRRYTKLKFFYGITKLVYDELSAKQNGLCAICGQGETRFARALAVDHDHITGKVRGLLCASCNQGLGHFKDSGVLLTNAKKYLGEI